MTTLLTLEQRQERAERQIRRFVARFEPAYYDLVCHAALPLVLTPELVSYLRNEFLPGVPWIAEVDLLLSDLCAPVGYERYVMDAEVRAYALADPAAPLSAERKRGVANLLVSYVRYLAEHQSYLSPRDLEAQQWAAMLYLGETERQTVVSELVERFQVATAGGSLVGANLLGSAELARLAQLVQTLKLPLADYPELIEYAALVSDVQRSNLPLAPNRVEKTYVVAPGQFLCLPEALKTDLRARGRIQDSEPSLPVGDGANAQNTPQTSHISAVETSDISLSTLAENFPELKTLEFEYPLIDFEPDPSPDQTEDNTPTLQTFSFETVRVNNRGKVIEKTQATARYFSESLSNQNGTWLRQVTKRLLGQDRLLTLDMVLIPGGTFMMGSPDDEPERFDREGPQHEVTVPPFFMAKTLITQAQWRAVAHQLDPVDRELDPDPSSFKGDDRPVENVSWHDATEFCARLSCLTGRDYRLPTEAEWEYACRAGTTTPFAFGETLTADLANYDASVTYAEGVKGEYRRETTPVGSFPPNAFGLYDMHGNVWEWCQDHWHDNYQGAPTDGSAWLFSDERKDKNDPRRVLRGGSWLFNPRNGRSACRNNRHPDARTYNYGFRVVCSAARALQ
ncbi:MAG: formylglycine-generating enzyme family protein [Spirulina sp.]